MFMISPAAFERCLSFINSQALNGRKAGDTSITKRAVTLSRQSGCGGHALAEKIASLLQAQTPKDAPAWTLFDRNLVEQVLSDHHLPERLAKFMPEDKVPVLDDIMDELFELHPSEWTLVQHTSETMLRLAELGNVIILGRGGNVVTSKLPHVFHVRLVASRELRLKHMERFEGLTAKAAAKRLDLEDQGRARYLKKHFNADIDDPLLYHLVLNMDRIDLESAARLICDLVLGHDLALPSRTTKELLKV
jgi:cytidylate kinase